jgi:hypothetical protein
MSNIKPTPGRFVASSIPEGDGERWSVFTEGTPSYHIAVIENGAPGDYCDTERANALLLAASPEMLAALKLALPLLETKHLNSSTGDPKSFDFTTQTGPSRDVVAAMIKRAIRKAEDGQ